MVIGASEKVGYEKGLENKEELRYSNSTWGNQVISLVFISNLNSGG